MKFFVLPTLAIVVTLTNLAQAKEQLATITAANVILYETPSTLSPIVRRVFVGEVLKVIETVKAENGDVWGKVYLSPTQTAYLQNQYFANSGSVQPKAWQTNEVVRSRLPFSVSVREQGELLGHGLGFRFLPFTRWGVNLGVGSVVDGDQSRGFGFNYGVTMMFALTSFSPFIEAGNTSITLNDGSSAMRISAFYINVGVEWIIRTGYFIGVGASYTRSYDIQVGYDLAFAKANSGSLVVGNYGSFNDLTGPASLQRLSPLFILGYSF